MPAAGTNDSAREVVALPDTPSDLDWLDDTIAELKAAGVPFRIDPIIEPIGFGFAASLGRYLEVRRRHPGCRDHDGRRQSDRTDRRRFGRRERLLAGFCQELGIRSVLTTEVINWCRSCVREFDLARRLVYHAVTSDVLPKHLEPDLVMLRDPKLYESAKRV